MEKLLKILRGLHPEVDFAAEEHLIDNGILDSFDIVSLISEIQDEFDVTIDAGKILPENFNSVKALHALIQSVEQEEA